MTDTQTCPNCGTPVGAHLAFAKMLDCESCGTTIIRDGAALRAAGDHGVMLDSPTLIEIGKTIDIKGSQYTPIGHIRFDYGAGWWDEYWCPRSVTGPKGVWISVDEGDYAIEIRVTGRNEPKRPATLDLGVEVEFDREIYMLSETDRATCIAFRGGLPEEINIGEEHTYANFTSPTGGLLSLETWDGGYDWHFGEWVDPWKIKAVT